MKRDPRTDAPNFYRFARDYLHAYLPTVQGHSPKTIEAYRISLECFIDYLTDIEHVDRAEVSFNHFERQHLKAWLAWMIAQRHYAPATIGLRLSAVKAFLAYCSHEDLARLPATRPVFYSLHHGQPTELSVDTVAAVLKQAAAAAHTACPSIPVNIHCHMLRKTKAMDLYQQGIPLPIIMRLLGHENTSTTSAFYAFATMDMMRQAINAATPAITAPGTEQLSEDKLQALYDLR